MEKPTYTLIPMRQIEDNARELARKWISGVSGEPYSVLNTHKLASDIMNYSESANKELKDALKDLLVFIDILSNNKIDIKAHDQKVFDKLDQFKRLVQ